MHIPQSDTQSLSILSFEDSRLEAAEREHPDYDRDAWLYIPDHYEEYRYILGTRGHKPLICLGVNPSTAMPGALDNTLKSVERIAHHNGFDSFIMLNVYAQRATRPNDMDRTCNEWLHGENLQAFRYVLTQSDTPPCVWAAWGAVIEKRPYLFRCVWDMVQTGRSFEARWVKAGALSKVGHPHHPLYLRSDTPVEDFDIETYLNNQQNRFASS